MATLIHVLNILEGDIAYVAFYYPVPVLYQTSTSVSLTHTGATKELSAAQVADLQQGRITERLYKFPITGLKEAAVQGMLTTKYGEEQAVAIYRHRVHFPPIGDTSWNGVMWEAPA